MEEEPTSADGLVARAEATDRAARFTQRLAAVQRERERRRNLRRLVRIGWVVLVAGLGALTPLVVAAVVQGPDPTLRTTLVAAGVGALLGGIGPVVRDRLARRRGASAWDAYQERYVLLGDPSAEVRDADRPRQQRGGPPPPPQQR